MRLTVAHEFFHAIQRAYKETQSMSDQFFYELTSTWIEDIIVPDGDDYLYWLNDFFNNPQQSWEQTDGYSLALFGHYLSTQFEVITSEKESTIMRKVWENISNANTPSDILDGILQNSFNSSFQAAWLDFVSRNLFNDVYTDMNNDIFYYVDQGNELCTAPPTSALFIDADDSVENNLSVTNNTVTIKTIKSREDAVIQLSVVQSGSGYLGNIAYFLDSQNQYSLIQNSGADFVVSQFEKNEMLHFIYISPDTTTSIGLNINISVSPDESKFLAIYPNPIHFGDSPILQIEISTPVIPQIKIYNLLGAEVVNATILPLDQGRHNVSLTPLLSAQMPSGVYVMDVMVDNKIFTRKFTLIK
jgi:hypothetical protein